MMIRTYTPETALDDVVSALTHDGGVIVANQASHQLIESVVNELRPHFDARGHEFVSGFNGYKTLRLNAVLALSRASADLIAHPLVMKIADAVLGPHCTNYCIGSCTAIEICPGESDQRLHRDIDGLYPIPIDGVEFQISAMWALDDFTLENGATRIAPGSHLDQDPSRSGKGDVVPAVMSKGSVLFYLGSTVHGGGANTTQLPRSGLINTYCLGWLRQEENQYLSVPREIADSYPEHIRRLMGYQAHGHLGVYPGDPDDIWFNS